MEVIWRRTLIVGGLGGAIAIIVSAASWLWWRSHWYEWGLIVGLATVAISWIRPPFGARHAFVGMVMSCAIMCIMSYLFEWRAHCSMRDFAYCEQLMTLDEWLKY